MFAFVRKSIPNFSSIWPTPSKGTVISSQASASVAPPSRIDLPYDACRWESGTAHCVGPRTKAHVELPPSETSGRRPTPVVVIQADLVISIEQLDTTVKGLLARMYQKDDVLSSGFVAEYAIVKQVKTQANSHTAGINNSVILSDDFVCQYLEGQWELQANITCSSLDSLFAGPYLVVGNCIHEAWQLLPDTFDSFVCGIIPQESDGRTFRTLYSNVDIYKAVAVPSRWHYTPSAEKPLNGMRVTIKDNFSIENIRTTQTNRAWAEVNGPEAESAEFVNLLTAKGAKVIGKTKMCSFASSEEATDGWIDFHAPFNPRADGYQSSSGSTTGGATSLAGHDWVDVSIGTDTTGSIRWPAAWHGLFGLRMTHGAVDMTGVYKSCIEFDALGLLGRSLQTLERVAAVSLELDMTQYTRRRPKRILVSEDFLPWGDRAQQAMVEQFVRVLEKFLGFEREPMSIAKLWEASPPEGVHGKSLREYIENTAADLFYYDGYHEFDGFRAEYRRKFKKPPYVGPYMRWKWERGALVTDDQYKRAGDELKVYRKWFKKNVMGDDSDKKNVMGDASTTFDTILILPCGTTEPKYRDDPNKPPGLVAPFSTNYIASMIGLPQLVVPIGQLPYESRVSGKTEYLPVVSTIVGAKNSDMDLIRLAADALKDAGWATTVKTGELAFEMKPKKALCPIRNVVDPRPSSFAFDSLLPTPEERDKSSIL